MKVSNKDHRGVLGAVGLPVLTGCTLIVIAAVGALFVGPGATPLLPELTTVETSPPAQSASATPVGPPRWQFDWMNATVDGYGECYVMRRCVDEDELGCDATEITNRSDFSPPFSVPNDWQYPWWPGDTSRSLLDLKCRPGGIASLPTSPCYILSNPYVDVRVSGIGTDTLIVEWMIEAWNWHLSSDCLPLPFGPPCHCRPDIWEVWSYADLLGPDTWLPFTVTDFLLDPWPEDLAVSYTVSTWGWTRPDPEAGNDDWAEMSGSASISHAGIPGPTGLMTGNYEWDQQLDFLEASFVLATGDILTLDMDAYADAGITPPPIDVGERDGSQTFYRGIIELRLSDEDGTPQPSCCPGAGDCYVANPTIGCDDGNCCMAVAAVDPYCCQNEWDSLCAEWANMICQSPTQTRGVLGATLAQCGRTSTNTDCFTASNDSGCADPVCCATVCSYDSDCCEVEWNADCADLANDHCQVGAGGDCTNNCGWMGGPSCWCDNMCAALGDCCPNVCDECPTMQHCPGPCPGDITGSGEVNVDDLLIILNNWGSCVDCTACPADINGDCEVNVDDLLIVLNNWGQCP